MSSNDLVALGFIYVIVFLTYIIFVLNGINSYARRLGREGITWVFLGIIFTPIITFFVLYMKGETDTHRKERIIEEETLKQNYKSEAFKNSEIQEKDKDAMNVLLSH